MSVFHLPVHLFSGQEISQRTRCVVIYPQCSTDIDPPGEGLAFNTSYTPHPKRRLDAVLRAFSQTHQNNGQQEEARLQLCPFALDDDV